MDERLILAAYRRCFFHLQTVLVGIYAVALSVSVTAEEKLHLAVAANFAAPLKAVAAEFTQTTGAEVIITVSSSGTLFAQIMHGATFDIFLSADTARAQALVKAGRVSASDVKPYALGQLAFVSRDPDMSLQRLLSKQSNSMDKLAIANPKLAPYGKEAQEVFIGSDRWERTRPFVVMGKNVLQTYQFYSTGNVDSAFVAYSLVKGAPNANVVPSHLYSPIVQSLAVLTNVQSSTLSSEDSEAHLLPDTHNVSPPIQDTHTETRTKTDTHMNQRQLADHFVDYLLSEGVQQKLERWGYKPVTSLPQSKQ